MNPEPIWVRQETVQQLHRLQIGRYGGAEGIRDAVMMESALALRLNLWLYGSPSWFDLAAAYAYGIARNHPFVDGNKRVAFLTSALFLELNGFRLAAPEVEAAKMFIALAAGEVEELALAEWFAEHAEPVGA